VKSRLTPFLPHQRDMERNLNESMRRREKIAREIGTTKIQIAAVRLHMRELETIKEDLAAIDRTLGLHDIQVDTQNIRSVRTSYKRLNLPLGEMSRCIYAALRAHPGPTLRSAIYAYVVAKHPELISDEKSVRDVQRSVHDRLKSLARQGRLKRHHVGPGAADGIWSFPDEADHQDPLNMGE
jgi:hypothetical protein